MMVLLLFGFCCKFSHAQTIIPQIFAYFNCYKNIVCAPLEQSLGPADHLLEKWSISPKIGNDALKMIYPAKSCRKVL